MISSGTRLGPYEVVAPIGAGGMGEVWKARDTRLERSVAIKVLPAEFATNVQLKLRFEREAKAISQLTHPNICTLYDVGDGFLVMELLDGETLADRIAKGPLPLDQVIRIGTEIANALDRAHKAGIVHRDLKPSNVMLTKSGAKLLDFGLAKESSLVTDATMQKALTGENVIVGTMHYMAPEQIEGGNVDARTDIFALGALLYEMTTGKRAFPGKSNASVIASILTLDPQPVSAVHPTSPPALDHVITKCLAKDPDARWQSAADIAGELEWIGSGSAAAIATQRRARRPFVAIALAVIAAASIAAAVWFARRVQLAERPLTAELTLPAATPLSAATRGPIALSPDATRIALLVGGNGATGGGTNAIAIRDLPSGRLRLLGGTEGGSFPFWSPDGKRLGFFAAGKLKTISVDGGPVGVLCDARAGRGATWNRDGTIVFAPTANSGLWRISEAGGAPSALTKITHGEMTNRNPAFLPDGKAFFFTDRDFRQIPIGGLTGGALYAGFLDGRPPKRILDNASNAAVSGNHLFFVRNRNLVIQDFNARTLTATGTPFDLAESIEYRNGFDLGNFSVARDTIAYVPDVARTAQIGIFDPTGKLLDVKGQPGDFAVWDVSPDGKNVAVSLSDAGGNDVWLVQLDRGARSRVTFNNSGWSAAFSPDGKHIATATLSGATIAALDGSSAEPLFDGRPLFAVGGWTPDGKRLIDAFGAQYFDLRQRQLVPVVKGAGSAIQAALSPDGKWLAYTSTETGTAEVYVTEFPDGRGKWQASVNGGSRPRWSADGKRLYFIRDGTLSVVAVTVQDGVHFDVPQTLPIAVPQPDVTVVAPNYAIARDGRIITLTNVTQSEPSAVHLIVNWEKLLR